MPSAAHSLRSPCLRQAGLQGAALCASPPLRNKPQNISAVEAAQKARPAPGSRCSACETDRSDPKRGAFLDAERVPQRVIYLSDVSQIAKDLFTRQ
jgi:hypothetical protein